MCSRSSLAAALLLALTGGCGKPEAPATVSSSVADARKLLAEAGFPDGKGIPKLEVLYNTDEYHRQIAAAIQEMWRVNLGVTVELRNMEFPIMMGAVQRGDFEIARQGYIGEFADPLAFLELFTEDSRSNTTGWKSDRYEALVAGSNEEADPDGVPEALSWAEQGFGFLNPLVDIVPGRYLTSYLTEFGQLEPSSVGEVARTKYGLGTPAPAPSDTDRAHGTDPPE